MTRAIPREAARLRDSLAVPPDLYRRYCARPMPWFLMASATKPSQHLSASEVGVGQPLDETPRIVA